MEKKWGFQGNKELNSTAVSVRGVMNQLMQNINKDDVRPVVTLVRTDPSVFPCFQTAPLAADAVANAVKSLQFNHYPPTGGLSSARRAIAEHLSKDISYHLSPKDVYVTVGCTQAIEVMISALATSEANILIPRPCYPQYEARAAFSRLEIRYFDLVPDHAWEVDLDAVESLADDNTVAMVIINPGNPCGNFFTYQHLKKILESIKNYIDISGDPPTFLQGALPEILEKSTSKFFTNILNILRENADTCYERFKEIPCLTCPHKPEGAMTVMVKLNLSQLEGISDDMDFCVKLAKEESVTVLPGFVVGKKNWLRVTFAVDPSSLEDGLGRIKDFYKRHSKKSED